jgi:chromate reductase, NAD(P)H dehydrogenase (quinone)
VPDVKILGIPGSLRQASFNRFALRAAQSLLPPGASLDLFELEGIPPYNQDHDKQPPARVVELKTRVRAADAVLFSTPEYNYSMPGVLKNAIDWASRPFPENVLRHKPTAVIGASTGLFGAVWAQAEVRKTMKASGAYVLESELPVGMADSAFADDGALVDPELTQRLKELLADLVREVTAPVEA